MGKLMEESVVNCWIKPTEHLILKAPGTENWGNTFVESDGGYCDALHFFWFFPCPHDVKYHTIQVVKIGKEKRASLFDTNVLDFVTILFKYAEETMAFQ